MYFSIAKIASAFMAFNMVAANLHASCACKNGDSLNSRITKLACTAYDEAGYEWGGASYDETSTYCVRKTSDDSIAGNEWEAACQQIASSGFSCPDGNGTCYADTDGVRGSC